jgi:hypothetical protein
MLALQQAMEEWHWRNGNLMTRAEFLTKTWAIIITCWQERNKPARFIVPRNSFVMQ